MPRASIPSYIAYRGLASRVVLLMYVLAATGVTIPVPVSATAMRGKDRSIPFPCMDKACGCDSAAACFRGCCCSTKEERTAWFVEHGVDTSGWESATISDDPPATTPSAACESGSCCEKPSTAPIVKSCCAGKSSESQSSKSTCCQSQSKPQIKPKSCCDSAITTVAQGSPDEVRWTGVSISAVLRCRGIGQTFLDVPPSIPCPLDPPELGEITLIGSVAQIQLSYDMPAYVPDAPPPRA